MRWSVFWRWSILFTWRVHEKMKVTHWAQITNFQTSGVQINECSPEEHSCYTMCLLSSLLAWSVHVKIKSQKAKQNSCFVPIRSTRNRISHCCCMGCIRVSQIISCLKKKSKNIMCLLLLWKVINLVSEHICISKTIRIAIKSKLV